MSDSEGTNNRSSLGTIQKVHELQLGLSQAVNDLVVQVVECTETQIKLEHEITDLYMKLAAAKDEQFRLTSDNERLAAQIAALESALREAREMKHDSMNEHADVDLVDTATMHSELVMKAAATDTDSQGGSVEASAVTEEFDLISTVGSLPSEADEDTIHTTMSTDINATTIPAAAEEWIPQTSLQAEMNVQIYPPPYAVIEMVRVDEQALQQAEQQATDMNTTEVFLTEEGWVPQTSLEAEINIRLYPPLLPDIEMVHEDEQGLEEAEEQGMTSSGLNGPLIFDDDELNSQSTAQRRVKNWVDKQEYPARNTEIFDDEKHRRDSIFLYFGGGGFRDPRPDILPGVFKYGVQYRPKTLTGYAPELQLQNVDGPMASRTVTITGIPEAHQLRDVLARVRGGAVLKATVVNTCSIDLELGRTATITFTTAAGASAFALAASELFAQGGYPWKVALVKAATYPAPVHIMKAIEKGATRCLLFRNITIELAGRLFADLALVFRAYPYRAAILEDAWFAPDGTFHMHFAKVSDAIAASNRFHSLVAYKSIIEDTWYISDRCGDSTGELANPELVLAPISYGCISLKDISLHGSIDSATQDSENLGHYGNDFIVPMLDPHGNDGAPDATMWLGYLLPWKTDTVERVRAKCLCPFCLKGKPCIYVGQCHYYISNEHLRGDEVDLINHPMVDVAGGYFIWDYYGLPDVVMPPVVEETTPELAEPTTEENLRQLEILQEQLDIAYPDA